MSERMLSAVNAAVNCKDILTGEFISTELSVCSTAMTAIQKRMRIYPENAESAFERSKKVEMK